MDGHCGDAEGGGAMTDLQFDGVTLARRLPKGPLELLEITE
jgi:hypothetical protein